MRLRPRAATADSHPRVRVRTAGAARWCEGELRVELDPTVEAAVILLEGANPTAVATV